MRDETIRPEPPRRVQENNQHTSLLRRRANNPSILRLASSAGGKLENIHLHTRRLLLPRAQISPAVVHMGYCWLSTCRACMPALNVGTAVVPEG
jgi:hypothetical protein